MNLLPLLKKYYEWPVILLVSCVLASAYFNSSMEPGDFELHHLQSDTREPVKLPLARTSISDHDNYELQGTLSFGWAASGILRITPDDEVKRIIINEREVDLSALPAEDLSDWINGFSLDVSDYINTGENSITISYADYGGNMGMKIKSFPGAILSLTVLWLILVSLVIVIKLNRLPLVKKYYEWPVILLVTCVLASAYFNSSMEPGDFELHHLQSDTREPVSLPLTRTSISGHADYELHGTVSFGWAASGSLHITADDEVNQIIINGQEVDLSAIPAKDLSDWENGFFLDVSDYINTGENSITISYADYGGDMGMKIESLPGTKIISLTVLWLVLVSLALVIKLGITWKIPKLHTVLYCLIILGAVLRIWTIYTYNPVDHIFSDAQRHWEQGEDVLRSDLMSNTDPIMYQLYIGALLKLSLNKHGLVAFYTCILALIGPWLWYRFLRELQRNKTLALAGWAAISLLPSWISIYTYFMQETLLIPLLGAALWATWRARRKGTVNSFALMVLLWILAGLTRGISIPLAAVCCTALWLTQGDKLRKALISTVILLFILGPLTYRSYLAVHHFAPHGMGHLASIYAMSGKQEIILNIQRGGGYGFGSPSMDAPIFEPLSDWTSRRKGQIYVQVDFDKGWEDWKKAFDRVHMTWRDALWITGENLAFLFFGPSWPDNNPERLVDRINIEMRWLWAPALLAAIIWIFILRKRLHRQWLLPSLILAWFIVQGVLPIAVNEGRYRKPFEGLIIAQFILLLAAKRGEARAGQPYDWGIDPRLMSFIREKSVKIKNRVKKAAAPAKKSNKEKD